MNAPYTSMLEGGATELIELPTAEIKPSSSGNQLLNVEFCQGLFALLCYLLGIENFLTFSVI